MQKRLAREKKTVQVMIELFCQENHCTTDKLADRLCKECGALYAYCSNRIEQCQFRALKPVCLKCSLHCYNADKREQIRKVMRYSGPRMMSRHPVLAVFHLLDSVIYR